MSNNTVGAKSIQKLSLTCKINHVECQYKDDKKAVLFDSGTKVRQQENHNGYSPDVFDGNSPEYSGNVLLGYVSNEPDSVFFFLTNNSGKKVVIRCDRENDGCTDERHSHYQIDYIDVSTREIVNIRKEIDDGDIKLYYYNILHRTFDNTQEMARQGVKDILAASTDDDDNKMLRETLKTAASSFRGYAVDTVVNYAKALHFICLPIISPKDVEYYSFSNIIYNACSSDGTPPIITIVSYPDIKYTFSLGIMDRLDKKEEIKLGINEIRYKKDGGFTYSDSLGNEIEKKQKEDIYEWERKDYKSGIKETWGDHSADSKKEVIDKEPKNNVLGISFKCEYNNTEVSLEIPEIIQKTITFLNGVACIFEKLRCWIDDGNDEQGNFLDEKPDNIKKLSEKLNTVDNKIPDFSLSFKSKYVDFSLKTGVAFDFVWRYSVSDDLRHLGKAFELSLKWFAKGDMKIHLLEMAYQWAARTIEGVAAGASGGLLIPVCELIIWIVDKVRHLLKFDVYIDLIISPSVKSPEPKMIIDTVAEKKVKFGEMIITCKLGLRIEGGLKTPSINILIIKIKGSEAQLTAAIDGKMELKPYFDFENESIMCGIEGKVESFDLTFDYVIPDNIEFLGLELIRGISVSRNDKSVLYHWDGTKPHKFDPFTLYHFGN